MGFMWVMSFFFIIKLAGGNVKGMVQDRVMVKLKGDRCIIKYHEMEYLLTNTSRTKISNLWNWNHCLQA